MKAEKVNSSINEQISSYGFELLDEKLPDLGVTLNNKLVEIYQQFKESKVKVFQSQDKNKKFVIGLVPMLVINSLIERAVDAYRNGMGLYLQEAEGLQEQKEKNKEKIKEKSFITVLITAIRTVFNEELAKKFYFDEAEVEDLRTKLEDYKKATEDIYKYGIIAAMQEEMKEIKKIMQNIENKEIYELNFFKGTISDKNVVLVEAGVGKVNAARVTQILIDNFKVEGIINVGSAGSCNDELEIGDIVIGKKLVQHDFDITAFGHEKGFISNVGQYVESDEQLIVKIV